MTGQDAVNVAQNFSDKVGIDGVILTKMDGDTRGGAALSIKAVTGKPIFYVGMGEKLSDLEQFYPEQYGFQDPWNGRCNESDREGWSSICGSGDRLRRCKRS